MMQRRSARALLASVCAAAVAGCMVGPDYKRPPVSVRAGYTTPARQPQFLQAGGGAQHVQPGADIPGEWWRLFRSPVLDHYVREAMARNPSLEQAQATLRQAREQVIVSRGSLYPSLSGGANVSRTQNAFSSFGGSSTTASTGGSTGLNQSLGQTAGGVAGGATASPFPLLYSLYSLTVNASYNVDVWGGVRRSIESNEAQRDYQAAELEAAYLSITGNVVVAAITDASLRGQIRATQAIIDEENEALRILTARFELGAVSKADVLTQQTTVAQARASLPPLRKQLEQNRNQLMALLGRYPTQDEDTAFDLASLHLPETLPASLPSALVEQRPDIRAAEAQLHSATAQLGVTTANLLPQLTLSASYGVSGGGVTDLFQPGSELYTLGAGLTQPIFRGGALWHQRRQAQAQLEMSAAQYRNTVVGAFQNVADQLRAVENDAAAYAIDTEAARSAAESIRIARLQFDAGSLTYLSLLTTEQQYQQTAVTLVQANAQRYLDTAALFHALGGGWWHRADDPHETEAEYRDRMKGNTP